MASGIAPIKFDTRKGVIAPVKYLQKELLPLKGAVINALSSCSGMPLNSSAFMKIIR
jgi:hypothetical protein